MDATPRTSATPRMDARRRLAPVRETARTDARDGSHGCDPNIQEQPVNNQKNHHPGAADAAGGGGGSLDEDRDSTPTETTGPVGDPAGLDLLRKAGVSARVARSLSAEYPVGRIEEVVTHARGHGLGGGWIVTALRD